MPIDVDAMIGNADADFPALYQLFGGYFHQDWTLEYAAWTEAADNFVIEAPPHLRADAVTEIARILAARLDEDVLGRLLYPGLQCNMVPGALGLGYAEWLTALGQRLNSPPTLSPN